VASQKNAELMSIMYIAVAIIALILSFFMITILSKKSVGNNRSNDKSSQQLKTLKKLYDDGIFTLKNIHKSGKKLLMI
jgi:predicted transcriptional regulator YheO